MARDIFTLTLKSGRMITPTVKHLEFVRKDGAKFDFTPGQFITFHFTMDDTVYQRSYSIATIPTLSNSIEIAVSPFENGPGTKLLFGLEPGDDVETTGPFGRLVLRDEQPGRYILVATGTGVTPYRAMLPELLQRINTSNCKVVILLGVQSPNDSLYSEDFITFANEHPNLEFHAFYSRKMPDAPKAFEHQGYVQNYFDQLQLSPKNDIVYLCGNPLMIDQSFELLLSKGFETSQVRREKYISPKK